MLRAGVIGVVPVAVKVPPELLAPKPNAYPLWSTNIPKRPLSPPE